MEEILASIRRIIADDQQERPAEAAPPPEPHNDDVLDLAEMARPVRTAPPAPEAREIDFGDEAVDFTDVAPEPPSPQRPAQPLEAAVERDAVERLVSRETDAIVSQAFNLLASTVLSHNARTLEDLVADMLRPILKAWLDDNLPSMVERLVRAEIERVARGR